ncbi:response regulator [Neptunitalea lumnitzerae]|uniref:Response regulator n=1 Tax=Neptunitalea lumnitzerae TaxID=2965509 RepID=A0ABQ5ML41_9FLAO|nr:response regulator [Neptunitalea sp. Y10]GLB49662.1 response regulator [Neptunitalea sp. Y10]
MSKYILSIEDNANDIQLMRRIFNKDIPNVEIRHINNGEEALKIMKERNFLADAPSLVLLDIKMSGINGLDLLKQIKNNDSLRAIPIVIFSSSVQLSDLQRAYELSVNSYIEKPKDFQQLKETLKTITKYWLDLNKN